ncbi:hypothetical protein BC834DRAFT_690296 [Gloeopeniophorella convolvens]|nr:hypothetical protein BC834DRAFT_690296 [Gloeopeniophorella convolvens]
MRITVGSDDLAASSRVMQDIEVFDDEREKDQRLLAPKTKDGSPPVRFLLFALYKNEAVRVEGTVRRAGYAVGALHADRHSRRVWTRYNGSVTGALGCWSRWTWWRAGWRLRTRAAFCTAPCRRLMTAFFGSAGRVRSMPHGGVLAVRVRPVRCRRSARCARLVHRARRQGRAEHHILHGEQPRRRRLT